MEKAIRKMATVAVVAALVLTLAGTATAGPVGGTFYWQFDEDGTDAQDVLPNARTLTRLAGSRSTSPAVNPVPNPDTGTFSSGNPTDNDYAVTGPQFEQNLRPALQMFLQNPYSGGDFYWTLEGWFRRDEAPSIAHGAIIAATNYTYYDTDESQVLWNPGWNLRMGTSGTVAWEARDNDGWVQCTSNGTYDDGQWHHFAVTWDGRFGTTGWMQFYLDGVLQHEREGRGTLDSGKFTVGMWRRYDAGAGEPVPENPWGGELDEFRWTYDQVLVPDQFLNYAGAPIPEPVGLGLVGLALAALRRRRH
jgi:MYXO-CTERM domain-containing protein